MSKHGADRIGRVRGMRTEPVNIDRSRWYEVCQSRIHAVHVWVCMRTCAVNVDRIGRFSFLGRAVWGALSILLPSQYLNLSLILCDSPFHSQCLVLLVPASPRASFLASYPSRYPSIPDEFEPARQPACPAISDFLPGDFILLPRYPPLASDSCWLGVLST